MKRTTEQYGKTIEEAVRKGLEELKISKEDVRIEVLEEPKSGGVLGVLSQKLAKVRIIEDKKISKDVLNKTEKRIQGILEEMFNMMGDEIKVSYSSLEKQVMVKLEGEEVKHLIGYKGRTIAPKPY